jgi:R3H domain
VTFLSLRFIPFGKDVVLLSQGRYTIPYGEGARLPFTKPYIGLFAVTEPTKLSINPDAFIYAINQAYVARSKANGEFNSHLRYEPFLTKSWVAPKTLDFSTFKTHLLEIISHHFNVLPNFHRNEAVDIENISWFSHSIATFFADLDYLLVSFVGSKLPNLPGNLIPRAATSKNIVTAIQKYSNYLNNNTEENKEEPFSLFPLQSEANELLDQLYIQEIWSLIASFTKKTFGSYFELIQSYILWKYTTKETQQETIDWNIRPPCGAAYHKQFKELFDREREERFAKRNERNNKSRSDRDKRDNKFEDKKPLQHTPSKLVHKEKNRNDEPTQLVHKEKNRNDEPTQLVHKEKNRNDEPTQLVHKEKNRKEDSNHLPKSNGFQQSSISSDQKQQQQLEDALEEARQAIQKMVKNKNLLELNLAPQNSFIRRHQHSLITESGLETESLGESRSRHVCIKRKA